VFRLTSKGEVDPTFRPFAMPGKYPQGRFLRTGELAPGPGGSWYLSFGTLPGQVPPQAGPGLVRLGSDGAVDLGFVKELGLGLRDSKSANRPEGGGSLSLIVPFDGDRLMLVGQFDHLGTREVTSPLILNADGTVDTRFHPGFSTEIPPPPPVVSAKTSAYVSSDGKEHFYACTYPDRHMTITYLYEPSADPWGHNPSCLIHAGGDIATPGGGWQDCDLWVARDLAAGATCSEVSQNPLDVGRHR
jgi:hypothetical protein